METNKGSTEFYVHAYNRVDWMIVWETVTENLPPLKVKIQNILEEISED
jgi:uncharacterized protein with HEPN domain